MECLSNKANGMKQQNVHNDKTVHQWIDGFVDDTSIFTNTNSANQDIRNLVRKLQDDASLWSRLLVASGGKLELPKCFYYILNWKYDKNGDPVPMTIAEQRDTTQQLTLPNGDGTGEVVITQKEVTEAHKTLGTMKTIIGDESAHKSFLLTKSNAFATKVHHAKMSRTQAKMAYNSIYIPSMLYSIPATNLSEAELNIIQRKATNRFLSACGFEKGFPRAVVHGPTAYGGLGMPHLYTEGLLLKIEALISHVRANTSLGKAMISNLNWTQLVAGTQQHILESSSPINYIQHNWLMHIREFLIKVRGTITIQDTWKPRVSREFDIMLMDRLTRMKLGNTEQRVINNWRIFFQVNSCADITNAAGDRVDLRLR